MANPDVTFYQNATLKRASEVANADWDGGGNKAGSNACGLGINVAGGDVTGDWTVPDQHGVARDPQDSQHIGEGTGPGTVPITPWTVDGVDLNDTVSLTVLATGWVRNLIP